MDTESNDNFTVNGLKGWTLSLMRILQGRFERVDHESKETFTVQV